MQKRGDQLCESVHRCKDGEKRRVLKQKGNLTVGKVKERDSELDR